MVFTSHVPKTDALPTALHSGLFTLINNLTAIYLANQCISNRFCRLLHAKQYLKALSWVSVLRVSSLESRVSSLYGCVFPSCCALLYLLCSGIYFTYFAKRYILRTLLPTVSNTCFTCKAISVPRAASHPLSKPTYVKYISYRPKFFIEFIKKGYRVYKEFVQKFVTSSKLLGIYSGLLCFIYSGLLCFIALLIALLCKLLYLPCAKGYILRR